MLDAVRGLVGGPFCRATVVVSLLTESRPAARGSRRGCVETLLEQLTARLRDNVGDIERCARAEELVTVVCERLDRGDATADEVASAARVALGASLDVAEKAVAKAEAIVGGPS